MRSVEWYLRDYDASHRAYGNKATHFLGIPLIVLSLFGLLDRVHFLEWNARAVHASPGLVVWLLANVFYLTLHPALGACMAVATGLLYAAGTSCSLPVLIFLQGFGWLLQAIGHTVYEKKQPAFAKNLVHLLVGPAYLMNLALGLVKYK